MLAATTASLVSAAAIAALVSTGAAVAQHRDRAGAPPLEDAREVRGVIKALEEVTIAAGLSARIEKAPFRDGDHFRQGDILIAFDCAQLNAERAAAAAALRGHRIYLAEQRQTETLRRRRSLCRQDRQSRYGQRAGAARGSGTRARNIASFTLPSMAG